MKNYQIITSIWKVYQVLLEYCCKTDYRILIAELTDRHHAEVEQMERSHKDKIQHHVDSEKIMKQNMETMRDYNDSLEKERAAEKQLRLKLEEEYMQNTKNHEEEVKLRLKFEGKFNTMHDEHRELQIRHDRTLRELIAAQKLIKEHEDVLVEQAKSIVEFKKTNVELQHQLVSLKEYKALTEKDMRKKNHALMTAETVRA